GWMRSIWMASRWPEARSAAAWPRSSSWTARASIDQHGRLPHQRFEVSTMTGEHAAEGRAGAFHVVVDDQVVLQPEDRGDGQTRLGFGIRIAESERSQRVA